jgi:hypothetical protein
MKRKYYFLKGLGVIFVLTPAHGSLLEDLKSFSQKTRHLIAEDIYYENALKKASLERAKAQLKEKQDKNRQELEKLEQTVFS